MQMPLYRAKGRRTNNKAAVSKIPFGLAFHTAILAGIISAGALLNANAAHARVRPCSPLSKERECCSSQDCSGHVLGSRAGAKECERTFGGKSWHPASDGQGEAECTNL